MLVMTDRASSGIPQWAAVRASVTVDMPTASAPRMRAARISAGVSNWGPVKNLYTPSWTRMPVPAAQSRASFRSSGVYIRETSKKRGPNSSTLGPRRGLLPLSLMWSEMIITSPGR